MNVNEQQHLVNAGVFLAQSLFDIFDQIVYQVCLVI